MHTDFCGLLLFVVSVSAACVVEEIITQEDFQLSKYMGKWYEIRYKPYHWEDVTQIYSDYTETYSVNEIGTEIDFLGIGRPENATKCNVHSGQKYAINANNPAKWKMSDKKINATAKTDVDCWILATDYDNYAVAYGCDEQKSDGTCNKAHAWVWSRKTTLANEYNENIEQGLQKACLNTEDLMKLSTDNECSETSGASHTDTSGRLELIFAAMSILILNPGFLK